MDEDDRVEIGRGVHIGTATNRSNGLLQLPSFSYALIKVCVGIVATYGSYSSIQMTFEKEYV